MADELRGYVADILRDAFVLSLGIADQDGPWVADLVYVHDDDFNLYWISLPESRHSRAIEAGGKVACTVHATWGADKERALQIEGTAVRLQGPQPELQAKLDAKEAGHAPESDAHRVDKEKVWYKLAPTRIELILNEKFGYARQTVL